MLTFNEYFGGLDKYNLSRGRFEAFFVYNRATTRGDLWDRLGKNSSNDNVQAVLNAIPKDARPGISGPTTGGAVGVGFSRGEGGQFG